MKTIAISILLIASTLGVYGGSPQSDASVQGTVSRLDGVPVAGAQIQIGSRGQSGYQAVTDSQGHFVIEGVTPDTYRVTVDAAGLALIGKDRRRADNLTVTGGQQIQDFHVEMLSTGTIAGRVVRSDGSAYIDGAVAIYQFEYVDGRKSAVRVGTPQPVTTDDHGDFRAFGLRPGTYFVSVDPPSNDRSLVQTYFPGTGDITEAVAIRVREAEQASANFQIRSGPFRAIRGIVTSPTPDAVNRFFVTVIPLDSIFPPNDNGYYSIDKTRVPPQGELSVGGTGMASGKYTVFVTGEGETGNYFGRASVAVGNDAVTDVSIPLSRGLDVSGHLKVEGDASALHFNADPIILRSMTEIPFNSSERGLITRAPPPPPNPPGSILPEKFTMKGIPKGHYGFFPQAGSNTYVSDVRQGDKSILESGLIIDGEPVTPIDVVLSSLGGSIDGILQNDRQQGVGFVTTVLVPRLHAQNLAIYSSATSDYHGHFSLTAIAPGEYELFAWSNVPSGAWMDQEFLKAYENRGTKVTVNAESHISDIHVKLITGE